MTTLLTDLFSADDMRADCNAPESQTTMLFLTVDVVLPRGSVKAPIFPHEPP